MAAIASSRSFPAAPLLRFPYDVFLGRQDAPQSISETVHGADRIIGWYVYRVFVAGGFFQHVCGNSEPVSAT